MDIKTIEITAVAERLGLTVNAQGKALCPNHDDHHESLDLVCKDGKNFAYCHACNWSADPAALVMEINGCEFPEAVQWLKHEFGGNGKMPAKKSQTKTSEPGKDYSPIYDFVLDAGGKSSEYLIEKRKIKADFVDGWEIKEYSREQRKELEANLKNKFSMDDLIASGIFGKSDKGKTYFNFYDRSLIFPFWENNKVVYLQGRIDPAAKSARGKYIHLAGRKAMVPYGLSTLADIKPGGSVYIVEGLIDALTLNSIGLPAVGIPGAGTKLEGWEKFFPNYEIIHIAQNDKKENGKPTAAETLKGNIVKVFAKHKLQIFHIPKKYKDLNEWHVALPSGLTQEVMKRELVEIIPEKVGLNAKDPNTGPLTINLSEVEPREVTWLWKNFIPIGAATLISGDPGCAKTWIALDIAARVSRGTRWIDGSEVGDLGNTVYLSVEDNRHDTIRPRFDMLGGNPKNFNIYDSEQPIHLNLSKDGGVDRLGNDIIRIGNVRLVVVDPIADFSGGINANAADEVRSLLTPLIDMAARLGFALLIIGHLNKNQTMGAIYRAGGSTSGWLGKCRAAFMIFRDVDDQELRHIVALKANLAKVDPPQLEFRLSEGQLMAKVSTDVVNLDEHLNPKHGRPQRERLDAGEWLAKQFADHNEIPALEITEAAKKAGISYSTLKNAKAEGGYTSKKIDGKWLWGKREVF